MLKSQLLTKVLTVFPLELPLKNFKTEISKTKSEFAVCDKIIFSIWFLSSQNAHARSSYASFLFLDMNVGLSMWSKTIR